MGLLLLQGLPAMGGLLGLPVMANSGVSVSCTPKKPICTICVFLTASLAIYSPHSHWNSWEVLQRMVFPLLQCTNTAHHPLLDDLFGCRPDQPFIPDPLPRGPSRAQCCNAKSPLPPASPGPGHAAPAGPRHCWCAQQGHGYRRERWHWDRRKCIWRAVAHLGHTARRHTRTNQALPHACPQADATPGGAQTPSDTFPHRGSCPRP